MDSKQYTFFIISFFNSAFYVKSTKLTNQLLQIAMKFGEPVDL